MLTFLRISDFALIDALELELGQGLTVITGETGAGKSILVEALGLLRGGRVRTDVIRTGCEQAQIEAQWELPDEGGEPRTLVVRRIVTRTGRGRNYIDGTLATVGELCERVGELIDITSQHDQQSLMDPESQRAILDAYANNGPWLLRMAEAYAALVRARAALNALDVDGRARLEREEFLRFQLRELEAAALIPGEDAQLRVERERIKAAERLALAVARSEESLYAGEGAVAGRLVAVLRELEPLCAIEPRFGAMVERLTEARALIDEVVRELGRLEIVRADPGRLDAIEERLYVIARLVRKHGGSIESALMHRDALVSELETLGDHESELERRRQAVAAARLEAEAVARELSERRKKAALALGPAMDETLAALGLAEARLSIRVVPKAAGPEGDELPALGARGADDITFEFTANPGEPARPLSKVASGGELSRVMLACKRALAHADRALTYVFDEVDTGVGGGVAEAIGRKLKAVAERRQVLVVTHMPQIAALADHHLKVEKRVRDGRTVIEVRPLDGPSRRDELARMLGGHSPSDEAVAHAGQLLRSGAGATSAQAPAPGAGRGRRGRVVRARP